MAGLVMKIDSINNHKYIKLLEFALENNCFTVQQALDASGLSPREFEGAKYSLFMLRGQHENIESNNEVLEWRLKPEAYFSYVSYLEFKYSLVTSKRAWWLSGLSLFVASVSLLISAYAVFWK